jgi:hypothetical protein
MPPLGLEPTIPIGERPEIYALDRAATGTGYFFDLLGCLNFLGSTKTTTITLLWYSVSPRTSDHVPSEYEASFLVNKPLTLGVTVALTDSCFI